MEKYKKYATLCGAMMINGFLASSLYFGNLSTYIYSFHYIRRPSDSIDLDPSWILPSYLIWSSLCILTVDMVKKRIGLRITCVLGIVLFVMANLTSYFTVTHSIWALTLTFAGFGGMGNGLAATSGMVYLSRWFDSKIGLAAGLHKAASAGGGIVMNILLTAYINPHNLSPDVSRGELHLFSQPAVIDRLPNAFLMMAGVSAIVQLPGFLLLSMPKSQSSTIETSYLLQDSNSAEVKENTMACRMQEDSKKSQQQSTDSACSSISQLTENDQTQTTTTKKDQDTSDHQDLSRQDHRDFTPLQVLKSEAFYVTGIAVMSLAVGTIALSNYSKLFGQTWIKDDQFLAFVSSSACFSNILFLIGGGNLVDLIGLKHTVMAHLALCSIFLSLWYFTVRLSRWLYLIWTMVLYGAHFNQNLFFSVCALKLFGKQYFATNLGLIQLCTVVAYLLSASLMTFSLDNFGWFWLFFITGAISFSALVIVTLRMPRG